MLKLKIGFAIPMIYLSAVCSADNSRVINLPKDVVIGKYSICRPGDLGYKSLREGWIDSENGLLLPRSPVAMKLEGRIEIADGAKLAIEISSHGDVSQKLAALELFRDDDIIAITCLSNLQQADCARICRFTSLRSATLAPCIAWESFEGAQKLAKLNALKFLRFESTEAEPNYPFGSTHLVDAIFRMRKLRVLELPCDKISNADIARLGKHWSIERLVLWSESGTVGAAALNALADMRMLRELDVACSSTISDNDVLRFSESSNLEALTIRTRALITCQSRFNRVRRECDIQVIGLD